jgi:hypothetical protein
VFNFIEELPEFLAIFLFRLQLFVELLEHFSFVDDSLLVFLFQQFFIVDDGIMILFLDEIDLFNNIVFFGFPLVILLL